MLFVNHVSLTTQSKIALIMNKKEIVQTVSFFRGAYILMKKYIKNSVGLHGEIGERYGSNQENETGIKV